MKINRETLSVFGYGLRCTRVDLSSVELLNLHASPVTLVPAPGTNKVIIPCNFFIKTTFGTTAYTLNEASPQVCYAVMGPDTNLSALSDITFSQSADNVAMVGWGGSIWSNAAAPTEIINQPLCLCIANDMTDGDGTATVWTYYVVQDLA